MTALALTPDTTAGTILLSITGAPAGPVTITRTDANGSNPVRLRTGQEPVAGSLILTDYEPALAGGVAYDVVDSAAATATASTTLETTAGYLERFASVQIPSQQHTATLVLGYEAEREPSTTIHEVIGRADPVPVVGVQRLRRGTLEVFAATYAEALNAALTASSPLLMYRQSDYPGMDMYFTPTSVRTRPLEATAAGWRWSTSIGYVEVRSPRVPLLGDAGWTIDDLVASYPTVAAVRAAFPTVADLLVGP